MSMVHRGGEQQPGRTHAAPWLGQLGRTPGPSALVQAWPDVSNCHQMIRKHQAGTGDVSQNC